jgi:hypothetical protein
MIENYNNGCCGTMIVTPAEDMERWAVQQVVTVLANSDYYYTKSEVDNLLKNIHAGMTPEEVQEMIDRSIASKANQSDLDALAQNTYTKQEVNGLLASYYTKLETKNLFANYSKVEGKTLILNSENIS